MRGRLHTVQIEPLFQHRFDRGDHQGHVLGPATRHGAVDGDLLDGGNAITRGNDADDFTRVALQVCEHAFDRSSRWRHDGQTVRPLIAVAELDGSFEVFSFENA
jgi:hypothetical protein